MGVTVLTTLTGYPVQGGQGGRTDPTCSQTPLSLTVAESWLPTAISTVEFAVPRTICFQIHPRRPGGVHPDRADRADHEMSPVNAKLECPLFEQSWNVPFWADWLSCSAGEPAFPSRPDNASAMVRSGGEERSGATRSHAQRALQREHGEDGEHRTFRSAPHHGTLRISLAD